jgi:hypothetical protein
VIHRPFDLIRLSGRRPRPAPETKWKFPEAAALFSRFFALLERRLERGPQGRGRAGAGGKRRERRSGP